MISFITSHCVISAIAYIGISIFAFVLYLCFMFSTKGNAINELVEFVIMIMLLPILLPAIIIYWFIVGLGELKNLNYAATKDDCVFSAR